MATNNLTTEPEGSTTQLKTCEFCYQKKAVITQVPFKTSMDPTGAILPYIESFGFVCNECKHIAQYGSYKEKIELLINAKIMYWEKEYFDHWKKKPNKKAQKKIESVVRESFRRNPPPFLKGGK